MKLGYTIIYVADVLATVAFYEKAFGLARRFVHESNLYAEMETGSTALAFAGEAFAETAQTTTAGEATSRGTYLVIRVGVKNQSSDGATLFPSEFALVDSTGAEYPSLSESDAAYQSAQNGGSPYVWPHNYPVGQFATATVIFDIPNSIRGLQLVIRSVPSTRIRLD